MTRWLHVVLVAIVLSLPLSAQVPRQDAPAGVNQDTEYRIGPADLISVSVFGLSEISAALRVSNSGKVHVRHLGILRVAGKTPAELEAEVATMLRERGLVRDPSVQVQVIESRAQPVYILGEVMVPGQFVITREMYLTDLVTLGQGFNDVASPVGYLYRYRQAPRPREDKVSADASENTGESAIQEVIPIDFRALEQGTQPNVRLRGGDVLYCPQKVREFFYVVGDVMSPGLFEIPSGVPLSLSQAIARAGGPTRTAKLSKGTLVRYDGKGAREELPVDFGEILKGKRPDIPVRANDLIFIPGSASRSLAYGLLGIIPGVASGAVAGAGR